MRFPRTIGFRITIGFGLILIGVIEIASLEIIQDFQIEFVERIGSTIASSLSGEQITATPDSPLAYLRGIETWILQLQKS
jgi:hypothetical protein